MLTRYLALVFLLYAGPLLGQTHSIFVSSGPGGANRSEIIRFDCTVTATTASCGSPAVIHEVKGGDVRDLVVGPDEFVYAIDRGGVPERIFRLKFDGSQVETIFQVTGPPGPTGGLNGPTFLDNDLFFLASNGLFRIPGIAQIPTGPPFPAPEKIVDRAFAATEGTTVTLGSEFLMVDRGAGKVFIASPPFVACPTCTPSTDFITGLSAPVGFGTSADAPGEPPTQARTEKFVAVSNAVKVFRCPSGPSSCSVDRTISLTAPDRPLYLEIDLEGNAWVVTGQDLDGSGGKLHFVRAGTTTANLVVTFSDFTSPPNKILRSDRAVGLAVGETTRSETETYTGNLLESRSFNCGSSRTTVTMNPGTPGPCTLSISCEERPPKEINDLLQANLGLAEPPRTVQYDWNGGFGMQYVRDGTCPDGVPLDLFFEYFNINDADDSFPVICKDFVECGVKEYFRFGTLAPEDQARRGVFSSTTFVLADLGVRGNFGEFRTQFSPDPNNPIEVNQGSGFPIRLTAVDDFGDPIPDCLVLLSVASIQGGTFQPEVVQSKGGANEDNVFRFDPTNDQYVYNLDTTGYQPGLHVLTIVSDCFEPQEGFINIVP